MSEDLTKGSERILHDWFDRQMVKCGRDPQEYDFMHEIDRSLTYMENKHKLEDVLTFYCGPKPVSKREAKAQAAAAEYEANKCPYCGTGFRTSKKLESSAEEQLKAHIGYERSKVKGVMETPEEKRRRELMEEAKYEEPVEEEY